MINHEEEIRRMQGVLANTEKELKEFDEMMGEVAPLRVWIYPTHIKMESHIFYDEKYHELLKLHNLCLVELDDPERFSIMGKRKHLFNFLYELCREHDVELI